LALCAVRGRHPTSEIGLQVRPSCIDHILREVKGYNVAPRQGFQQVAGQPACAAARVENGLISS